MKNYIYSLGRKKTSIAKVTLIPDSSGIIINEKPANKYFQNNDIYLSKIQKPLQILGLLKKYKIYIKAHGGGLSGQSSAIQLAIARFLCQKKPLYRSPLCSINLLTRDSRCKERRKYGLKKARKAPQYSKR